ncbi:MAG: HAMP domain-containing histidine kinase, partial [Oscillospiraceae bacterium]|nr:HAMP domain-containing histidine kinase [Oscillospiraceae bacterium]
NLGSIGDGINLAVEQRIKSERLKTELITNVSHDIKTPLTSIINYSDLIGREECTNPRITEYAEVLNRQSERLKRLIDDLVEASKASTGNLEVNLTPCDVSVMLAQAEGEYRRRLEDSGLELVLHEVKSDTPLRILADGRRLWRVFDNLLSNACKYAQSGTRVYLTLEKIGNEAVISFKNISRASLELAPEELMERFVRGDKSRTTEGNGLGLSIAQSLTELQGGTLGLSIDGDLFKVVLKFPLI